MESWAAPPLSTLPREQLGDAPALSLYDLPAGHLRETDPSDEARLYVCGITPYDATHMGHAATYVAFDLAVRAWRAAGHAVRYVQNVTDVDDPLLDRAREIGIGWQELAERETQLFRDDMAALSVLPPDVFVGAVESIPLVVDLIQQMQANGAVYAVDDDLYFPIDRDPTFGAVSGLSRDDMLPLSAERGGDPDRPGKRDPLDALLWQQQREGEPGWASDLGTGRPGWHTECSAIALHYLGADFDVQGGGSDLVFPHHEMSASQAQAARPNDRFAKLYAYAGMVGFEGHKMSKSRGNLVLVSALRADGVDPRAIRLTLLGQHYRTDWEWSDGLLDEGAKRLACWTEAVRRGGPEATEVARAVRAAVANDLDTPRALAAVDAWADSDEPAVPGAAELVSAVVGASLGVAL
ncbi:MAG: cysteine--1-D-myo-inosityl 2-amino-2-deoxy-alpha-D-glucopyranoside ligase [Nocardioidaceae bacterium]